MKLTEKQKRFCDYYIASGNATESATKAGYSKKTAYKTGSENLSKPQIKAYIAERTNKASKKRFAGLEEVYEFWTRVLNGEELDATIKDKIKVSELIQKSSNNILEVKKMKAEIDMIKAKTDILKGEGQEIEDTSEIERDIYGE